jgi:hypothetical protein
MITNENQYGALFLESKLHNSKINGDMTDSHNKMNL